MYKWAINMYGLPGGGGWSRGRGWGRNPFPFCKAFPWLPKGWRWMYPYTLSYSHPMSTTTYPYGPEMELQFLKERERIIKEELEWIKRRIKEIEEGE
jgi:hypothetical protein